MSHQEVRSHFTNLSPQAAQKKGDGRTNRSETHRTRVLVALLGATGRKSDGAQDSPPLLPGEPDPQGQGTSANREAEIGGIGVAEADA